MGQHELPRKMRLRFDDASLSDITDLNASFATGKLRVMYTGENRNGSAFSPEVVENALPTLRNIPIVAHYDIDANSIGSHDVGLVRDENGIRFRNLTEPCGVVPESAEACFAEEADEGGVTHNYLKIEPVILWKRQEVFRHITEDLDGKVDHSMEVSIHAFHKDKDSDVLVVDDFSFEALCLLESAEPCFEGSELELFSTEDFRTKMEQMMGELRETFSETCNHMVNPPTGEIDIEGNHTNEEGGRVLDEKLALLEEFQMSAEELDFSIDDFSVEELREKFEAIREAAASADVPEADGASEPAEFELSCNMRKVICDALQERKVQKPWGEEPAFLFEDFDPDAGMVYAICTASWNLFGLPYRMEGDSVVVDFDAARRMKLAYVEFDEGEEVGEEAGMFSAVEDKFLNACEENRKEVEELTEKFDNLNQELTELKESTADIEELRTFRANAEAEAEAQARCEVFSKFEDLNGNEAFEALRADSAGLGLDELEEKCYAIRGKIGTPAKFAVKEKTPKLRVMTNGKAGTAEPYGGLFLEYGKSED